VSGDQKGELPISQNRVHDRSPNFGLFVDERGHEVIAANVVAAAIVGVAVVRILYCVPVSRLADRLRVLQTMRPAKRSQQRKRLLKRCCTDNLSPL